MPVTAFVLDMDGTMVDSMPAHGRSWETFTQRHGVAMSVEEVLRKTTGKTGVECIRILMGDDVSDEDAKRLIDEKEALYREYFAEDFREVPGFARFASLAQQRGLKLAIATAGDKNNIAFVLDRLQLAKAPDAIVGGDEGIAGSGIL